MTKQIWLVMLDAQTMHCKRCNTTYTVALPISINMYAGLLKAFQKDHKFCMECDRP